MKQSNLTNKKFAILSMQRIVNFGSVLQAYSLREILREVTGISAAFLDIEWEPCLPSKKTVKTSVDYEMPAAYPPGILQRAKRWIITRLSAWNKHLIRNFMKQELKLTDVNAQLVYDCVVVGSDEVLNHRHGVCLQLHGQIKRAKKIISYAASCGSAMAEDIDPEDKDAVRTAMSGFCAMSVRDRATERYVSSFYEGTIERHLDPVLMGNLHKRPHKPVRLKKYLLVYAYGQRIRTAEEINAICAFAKARGLKVVAMGGSQFWCDLYIPTSPFRLLDYFWHADYVVTDTFHGSIFSVINRKKFAVISRQTNCNKITGLLQDLGLEGRLLDNMEKLESILPAEIDYTAVESILERERVRSKDYLKKHLKEITMEQIILAQNTADCCGCGACLAVCPVQAITMEEDKYGCMYPKIDASRCVHCGKCTRVCQYTKPLKENLPVAAYAAVGTCEERVKNSASGGIFAALANSCVDKGGFAAGAVMDCSNSQADVYHLLSREETDLCRMQGSKYVHSDAWKCYSEIVQTLKAGKTVLFSGTPCQVAAVKALTGDPENLFTVDVICHGVPPQRMLNDYLKILSRRFHGQITEFRFREKTCGKQFTAGILLQRAEKAKRVYLKSTYLSFYRYFLSGAIYRENCYSCPYAGSSRVSDITIGDYWGVDLFHGEALRSGCMPDRKDWSCVLVNTEKGARLLAEYGEQIDLYPSRWEWAAQKNQQLREPSKPGKDRNGILKLYAEAGYEAVEAAFVKENGGRLRFFRRMIRNIMENNRTVKKHAN